MLSNRELEVIRQRAGIHSDWGRPVPNDREQKLYYGLLEILDFECCKYGDAPTDITEADIKQYLLEHKDRVRCEALPTLTGLFSGAFSFLEED